MSESLIDASKMLINPPISEVGIGLSFLKNPRWDARIFGTYYGRISVDYPNYQSNAPIFRNVPTHFITINSVPDLRGIYSSENNTELLQLQSDLFVVNWRFDSKVKYQGFEQLKNRFASAWTPLAEVADYLQMPIIQVNSCEVSYTNLIDPASSGLTASDLIRSWSGFLGDKPFSTTSINALISWSNNCQIVVNLQPVVRISDGVQILQLTIAATGIVNNQSLYDYVKIIDYLHNELRSCFDQLTTTSAKEFWNSPKGLT